MRGQFTNHVPGIRSKVRKKDGKRVFYAEVYSNGKRYTEKAGTTERQAYKKLSKMQAEVDNGRYIPPRIKKHVERQKQANRLTFAEFGDEFIERNKGRWKGTIWHEDMVRFLGKGLGKFYIDEITPRRVQDYLAKRRKAGIAASTLKHELLYLKTMLKAAVDWGIIETNPASKIKPDRVARTESKALTADERAALIEAAETEFAPVIRFALQTGMRWGEIASLTWEQVDLKAATARLIDTKTNEPRTVPLMPEAVQTVRQVPRIVGSPFVFQIWTRIGAKRIPKPMISVGQKGRRFDRYRRPWTTACRGAGIEATPHVTRHTFASEYVMRNGNPFDLLRICGWTDYAMVEKTYGHLAEDYLQGSIRRMAGIV